LRKRYIHIRQLVCVEAGVLKLHSGKEMQDVHIIENAWLETHNDLISAFGSMPDMPEPNSETEWIDCTGRVVLPGYCDSHTHIIFAQSRASEFVDKIKGLSYEEIARQGGGILNSARRLQETSETELLASATLRAREMLELGTTTFEVKSGYGLTLKDELKMLRVAASLRESIPQKVKITFLGAHAIPPEYKGNQTGYVQLIIDEMLPAVAAEGLADYVDVFCDEGFFTPDETAKILDSAAKWGMRGKIHANELAISGGVQVGVAHKAVSVDHLEQISDAEIQCLLEGNTLPVALPGTSFFLRIPYAPARKLIDAGLPLALASDYNPGSSPSGNMNFIMSLACINQRLLPEEALTAVTLNGAYALELSDTRGSLTIGKKADFLITEPMDHFWNLAYNFGKSKIDGVVISGKFQKTLKA